MSVASNHEERALDDVRDLLGQVCTRELPLRSVSIVPEDEHLSGPFRAGAAAGSALAAIGVLLSRLGEMRTGKHATVKVDSNRAAATLIGLSLTSLNGEPLAELPGNGNPTNMSEQNPTVGLYQCADGRWIHLHGGLPHFRDVTLSVLGCGDSAASIAAAVRTWNSLDLEKELAARRACGAVVRASSEWLGTEQGSAVRALGPVKVEKVSDSPPMDRRIGRRVLEGMRVLDLTRVLAGPTCGKVLAHQGADVLTINSPDVPDFANAFLETSQGKRSVLLDLADDRDLATAKDLAQTCDVVVNSYRSGALDRFGFGPQDICENVPGSIYVSINCYGTVGPWSARPGWEHLAQTVSGMVQVVGESTGRVDCLPVTVCDYVTGYLATVGVLEALRRRSIDGGSYHVRASLCQTAMWVMSLGIRNMPPTYLTPDLLDEMSAYTTTITDDRGEFKIVENPLWMDGRRQPVMLPARLGAAQPRWKS